jgi:hypothetical protein
MSQDKMPLKASKKKRIKEINSNINIPSLSKSPSKSILKGTKSNNSPSKRRNFDISSKVVMFDEEKIKDFMAQVWREMINNYGMIEQLQGKLSKTPKKKKQKTKLSLDKNSFERASIKKKKKRRKASKKKSRSIKRTNKKSNSKVKIQQKKKNRLIKTEKLKRPPKKREKETREYFSIRDNRMNSELDIKNFEQELKSFKKKTKIKNKRSSTVDTPKKVTSISKTKKEKKKVMSKYLIVRQT